MYFQSILFVYVLSHIWKFRNDDIFNSRARRLTESLQRLIYCNISMQVSVILKLKEEEFLNPLQDVKEEVHRKDISYSHTSYKTTRGDEDFDITLTQFLKLIKERKTKVNQNAHSSSQSVAPIVGTLLVVSLAVPPLVVAPPPPSTHGILPKVVDMTNTFTLFIKNGKVLKWYDGPKKWTTWC